MEPSCPLGTTCCIPQEKVSESHIINPLLTKFFRSTEMAGYWPRSFFCEFIDIDFVSVHKHAKKELGQYPAILTSHLVNNPYLLTELSRSVWESLDLGRVYRPHCFRSVLTTSVKILPYRPPTRLIAGSRRARNLVCTPYLDFGGNLFCQNRSINPRKPIRSHFHSNKIF